MTTTATEIEESPKPPYAIRADKRTGGKLGYIKITSAVKQEGDSIDLDRITWETACLTCPETEMMILIDAKGDPSVSYNWHGSK